MKRKAVTALGVAGMLAYCIPCVSAKAASVNSEQSYSDEIQPRAAGLIKTYEIYVSASNGDLCLNGSTISGTQMKTIGIKDIDVERSSDNANWSYYKSLDDMLESSSSSKYVNNYTTRVDGGYYYRITCNHYAKASTFGSSQTVENTSNSVWID